MTDKTFVTDAAPRIFTRSNDMRFYTIASVAELLAVSTRTVRRWIERGHLVAHRFGTAVRIADSDLTAFVTRHAITNR